MIIWKHKVGGEPYGYVVPFECGEAQCPHLTNWAPKLRCPLTNWVSLVWFGLVNA